MSTFIVYTARFNKDDLYQFDGVSWGLFPTPKPTTAEAFSIHGQTPDDFWVLEPSALNHWNGSIWTTYNFPVSIGGRGSVHTSADGGVFVGCGDGASLLGELWRLTGGSLVQLWTTPFVGFNANSVFPWVISQTECLAAVAEFNTPPLFKWTLAGGIVQHPSGLGLPYGMAAGIAVLGSEIFVLFTDGRVFRGTWGGTWTHDNPTDGPFTGIPSGSNTIRNYITPSADGQKLCVQSGTPTWGFWVRNGPDDWGSDLGPTGTNIPGEPQMADDVLLATSDNAFWSDDAGATWAQTPQVGATTDGYGAWAYGTDTDPPILQNQNPPASSTGNRGDMTQYLEVIDPGSGVNASSVEIYFGGVLAWGGNAPAVGWSGSRGNVVDGYSYTLIPDVPLPPGTIIRRVVARDLAPSANLLDTSETFNNGSFLDGVDVSIIPTVGGIKMTATGLFSLDPMKIHLGPLGSTDDPECYGGSGLSYSPMSLDGVTVEFASPPLAKGSVDLTIVDGSTTLNLAAIKVVERNWPGQGFNMRKDHPPWGAVGAKRLELEDLE